MVVAIVVFMHPNEPDVYESFSPKKVNKKKKKNAHRLPVECCLCDDFAIAKALIMDLFFHRESR